MSAPVQTVDEPLYGASPVEAVRRFFRRYVVFTGRASRSEFWWTYLFVLVVVVVLGVVGSLLGAVTATAEDRALGRLGGAVAFAPITIGLFVLAILLPGIALVVRRLHDAGLSGLLALLWLVPYVGGLIILILCILPSQPQGRRFDRDAAAWAPTGAPATYGAFGASPYGAPAAARPAGAATPEPADLSHALAPMLGADRAAVAAVAQRFGATIAEAGPGLQRLDLPGGAVLAHFDEQGRLYGVQAR